MNRLVKYLTEYYGETLNSLQASMYNSVLDRYSFDCHILAMEIVSTYRTFPPLSDIIGMIEGSRYGDIKGESMEIADKIIGSIKAFGYNNVQDAYDYIGEEGWKVVVEFGGWRSICENELGIVTLRKYLLEKSADLIKNQRDDHRREKLGIDKNLFIDRTKGPMRLADVLKLGGPDEQ